MDLKELQQFQREHDLKFHSDVMSWERADQFEHCALHLAKLSGLFGSYCEKMQRGESVDASRLFQERIPDLLVFALKMATLVDLDLEVAYMSRIHAFEERSKG